MLKNQDWAISNILAYFVSKNINPRKKLQHIFMYIGMYVLANLKLLRTD
jgi:hypothetical protein